MNLVTKGYIKPYNRFRLQRLVELCDIYAPSKQEEPVAQYVAPLLAQYCHRIERDDAGNLCAWRKGDVSADTVLLCCHMDTVFFPEIERFFMVNDGYLRLDKNKLPLEPDRGGRRPAVLGGDDRAGIEVILSVLETYIGPLNLRILLTTREEIGGEGMHDVDKSFLEGVNFGLVLDRRNSGDIISRIERVTLASKPLVNYVYRCGETQGIRDLRETVGAFSDAYFLARRNRIQCLNLSVAYYYPHTALEIIDLYAFDDCVGWVMRILDDYQPEHLLP